MILNVAIRLVLVLGFVVSAGVAGQDPKPAAPAQNTPQNPPPNPPPGGETWTTKTFDVKYVDPEEVRKVFASQSYVMEANRELKILTAHGSAAFLKEVEDTVKRLDVPPPSPPNTQITVYLVAGQLQAPTGTALPAELKALEKELPAKLADMQMFRVRAGQPGEATSAPPEPATAVTLTRIRVDSTSVTPGPKGDIVSLNGLKVWINIPPDPNATPSSTSSKTPKSEPDVTADLDLAPNEAVVVAKVGVDKPLAVVVRVGVVK
jgi:hypothetical protein